ncbi:hypothetical protein [Niabella sp.]|uniref:hypothetical protein n=1 Tax=Niabella sp. TaxID=1962976 RepID=UPI002635CD1B|nr:hypothetical protein [Niabella sp.]
MDVESKLGAAGALVIFILLYTIIKPNFPGAGETYVQVNGLHLAKDAFYNPGSRQSFPTVTLKFIESPRRFIVTPTQLRCVNHWAITGNFEKGAIASIEITETDYKNFKASHWYSNTSTLYGLSKDSVQFLSGSCRYHKEVEDSNQLMVTCLITGLVIIALIAYVSLNENGTARLKNFPLDVFLAAVFLITLLACHFFW